MILSFSKLVFKEKILNNRKIHTIRTDRSERWKKGQKIHFWIGNPRNTRSENKPHEFHKGTCSGVQKIEMDWSSDDLMVKVDNQKLDKEEVKQLAINDGFDSINEMLEWFDNVDEKSFKGRLIHWTKKRY